MVQTYGYDAFGNVVVTGTISQPFAFTGREYDAETSMYFYRARYYDPAVGRFVTKDPIGFAGGVNLYNYVGNAPITWVDPLGLARTTLDNAIQQAAARGDIAELETLLDAAVTNEERAAARAAINNLRSSGAQCTTRPASEKTAKDIAKQIERDLGKDARRLFHDMKEAGNRTLQQLKEDAQYLYEEAGKIIPKWLK